MKFGVLFVLTALTGLFANSGGGTGETDIFYRTINFLIFAAILYYLIADKIKAIFTDRSKGIAKDLDQIQERLKESKKTKEAAKAKVEEAKANKKEMLKAFESEKALINKKIVDQNKRDLEALDLQYEELKSFEELKMTREVVKKSIRWSYFW